MGLKWNSWACSEVFQTGLTQPDLVESPLMDSQLRYLPPTYKPFVKSTPVVWSMGLACA
ncbi:hypothetical protein PSE10C_18700 [Pseudomonas amygdali pv. eriobotryae]|uniref:Uncharacterized protein n=1 Tax=Pseudomonas amygdali pv. eriobotryae TaxID=129137 RepID=A0A9P3AEK1_PSEA0|nr:hypothetical protein PSE10A_27990 [Pseudomonas amygdali pv. eriobotryae]GFZ71128.1 hypothetical protein PSE10C_18700 [Pseudomonas amygdali pv. eriobotryae]